jgi:PAS domain S-box-containing protein
VGDGARSGLRWQFSIVGLAGSACYLGAWLGYTFAIRPAGISVIWPPSGLMLAMLVLLDKRHWPAAVAGAFAGNVVADLQHHASLAVALEGSAVNSIEVMTAAWLLVRLAGPAISMGSLREVGALTIGAAVVSNAVTALLGAAFLRHVSGQPFWRAWFIWWAGDGMGMLIVAPAILTWAHVVRVRKRIRLGTAIEATLVFGTIGVVAHFLLLGEPGTTAALGDLPYLAFALLIWAGVRLGPSGAATATLILTCVVAWNAAHAAGPFGQDRQPAMSVVLEIYSYLALAGLSSLIPAAILRERARAEGKLSQSELRFRQMAEHIKEAFFVVDLETGRSLYTSPTWSEIWGRPIAEADDPAIWFEAIHPDDRAAMTASMTAVKNGESSTTVFRVLRPDGGTRWVRGRAFPVRDTSGAVYRLAGVAEDITELRQAEGRLAQAQKMEAVGRLAGGVAHDFNNLLTVVMSHSDFVLADLPAGDPRRDDVQAIRDAADSATALTRQLLIFSRQQVLQPRMVRLNELVSDTGKMLKRLIGENIALVTALDPDSGMVKVDGGQMEQVIVNLVVNARDAMPQGGRLVIETRNVERVDPAIDQPTLGAGAYVMLAVTDTGVGMDAATQARIFEPFFTTKEPGKGTGIGLATVYGIVKQSGGHISVHSEPRAGTSFRIYLPRVDNSDAESASSSPAGD